LLDSFARRSAFLERRQVDLARHRLLVAPGEGKSLRAWAVDAGGDLDAPSRRGHAFRYSPAQIASRVLQAKAERVGLLTNGDELRLLLADPARPDSSIAVALDRGGWRGTRQPPDSYRLLLAVASPSGIALVPEIVELARLSQTRVTAELRKQARAAVEGFLQDVLDDPKNSLSLADRDRAALARQLWSEGLVLVYRLLFLFKMEASADPARGFSFASSTLWKNNYSPSRALAPAVRLVLDRGAETGTFLRDSLRATFRLFQDGIAVNELNVRPLGGMLFGADSVPLLDSLHWSERAVALMLDRLLWTPGGTRAPRERVHYGPLDVEDLGRVYEALLELEPGIASEPVCRLRRQKIEVVVPLAQGAQYKAAIEPDADDDDHVEAEPTRSSSRKRRRLPGQSMEQTRSGSLRSSRPSRLSSAYSTPHAKQGRFTDVGTRR